MPREKSPPPSTARLAKVDIAPTRVKRDPTVAQVMIPQSSPLPPHKPPAIFTAEEALTRSDVLVDQIPAVVEQMKYHKKQARRLAEIISYVYDAIDSTMPKPPPEDTPEFISEGLEKLIRVLYRIEERLRDIGSGNLVTRMNELPFVQHDLMELEDECVEVAEIFGIFDVPVNAERSNKAKHEDELALKDLAAKLEKDPDALADRIGLRGVKLDEESQKSLQIMLYSIEHSPHKVPPEFRSFAESAAKTIYSRTKQEVPHDLPWHVRSRDFKLGDRVGDGGFSTVYQGMWVSRQIQVAVKVFEEQGENIDKLIKEIVIWKDHDHPRLLKFFAGCLFDKPKFIVSPYCKNGNILEYLNLHPDGDRARMLLDVSRGMLYLHSAKIVHGDLKARNVLISDEERALVADFGLAEFERHDVIPSRVGNASSGTGEKTPRLIGTPHWLAPECFKDVTSDRKYADVWAMGMTSYELYEDGKIPLGHFSIDELSDKLEAGERPLRPSAHPVPDYLWKEMELCWSLNTIDRPSFSEITMVLGIFQDPEPDTLQEISHALDEGQISPHSLIKYPGLLERLVHTLMAISTKSGITIHDSTPNLQISPVAEQQAILALSILEEITSLYTYSDLEMQVITDAGTLTALLNILTSQDDIKNPEIITLSCQIIANVMRSAGRATRNDLTTGDFVDALLELIDSPDPKVATHAMSTVRTLINPYHWRSTLEEQLAQKKRVMKCGIIPKLLALCKENKEASTLCESLRILALLGTTPTSLEEDHVKEICPVLMDFAGWDAPLRARQLALDALSDMAEIGDPQAAYVRSCGLFQKLLDRLQGEGPELFADSYFVAGTLLQYIAEEEHIPSILDLLRKPEIEPPDDLPMPFGDDVRLCTKQSACLALTAIGNRIPTSEERRAVAHRYPVFNVLQPLLSSTDYELVAACRRALALYSSIQDFPFVLEHLGDTSSGARLMATQICVTLVERASEDNKIAAAESGILPILKAILDDPPPPPTPTKDSDSDQQIAAEDVPLPDSPTTTTDTELPDGPMSPRMHDMTSKNFNEEKPQCTDAAPDNDPTVGGPVLKGSADQGGAIVYNSNTVVQSTEDIEQPSQVGGSETVPPIKVGEGTAARSPQLVPQELVIASTVEPSADTTIVSAVAGGTKQPRSPRARAVTFGSVDRIIVVDTGADADEDEPDDLACTPRSMYEATLHDSPEEDAKKAKASAEAAAKTEAKNREEIYHQAYVVLEHILTDLSKDALDTVGEAYVEAAIHELLVNAIDDDNGRQLTCLEMLHRMSMSTDEVRLEMVGGELLPKLRSIMDSEQASDEVLECACNIVQALLSEDDDEDVMDAVVDTDFVQPLAKFMKHPYTDKTSGAEVLSRLILIFDDEIPEESVTLAISTLDDYCKEAPGNVENTFHRRMYHIVEYLRHSLPEVRKLGLSLASSFTKRSGDHRRTLANLEGLRDAVEECCKSGDQEISSIAKDILEKIKPKRVGAGIVRLRAARRIS